MLLVGDVNNYLRLKVKHVTHKRSLEFSSPISVQSFLVSNGDDYSTKDYKTKDYTTKDIN